MHKTENMEKDTPLVSIILPCYFQGEYLADALKSLLNQTYTNWEAIIINDGSNDSTEEVAKAFCNNDNRFHYFYQENKGVSSARNNAVNHSSGSFIVPLDPDDTIEPTFIEKCLNIFKRNPEMTLVYAQVHLFGTQNKDWHLHPYRNYTELLAANHIVCTSMFRKKDFLQIGGYDEQMLTGLEDWEFYIRLLHNGRKAVRIPETLFNYRIKESSRTTSCSADDKFMEIFLYIYRKHKQKYIEAFGCTLPQIYQQFLRYKHSYDKHHNKWYKKLWRRIRGKK